MRENRKQSGSFLIKTINAVAEMTRLAIVNETIALKNGFLQKRDPRAKIIVIIFLLCTTLISDDSRSLALLYAGCVVLAILSKINVGYFLKRTLPFIPLFSLFIIVPSLFSFVTPGEPLLGVHLFWCKVVITKQGLSTAVLFLMRVTVSVSFAVVLVLTTRHTALLRALRMLSIPQVFITTMEMSYRYIYVLLDTVRTTSQAIQSRVGFVNSSSNGQRIIGSNIATLWIKSYRLQSHIYDAMVSRGYSGEPVTIETFKFKPLDIVMLVCSFIIFSGSLWLNRFFH